jgi:hypothetical protein
LWLLLWLVLRLELKRLSYSSSWMDVICCSDPWTTCWLLLTLIRVQLLAGSFSGEICKGIWWQGFYNQVQSKIFSEYLFLNFVWNFYRTIL